MPLKWSIFILIPIFYFALTIHKITMLMAPDALVAPRLNLSDGGKNMVNPRNTTFVDPNTGEVRQQLMQLPPDANGMVKQKGVRTILQERGIWDNKLLLDCDFCKSHAHGPRKINCCARRLLSLQPDFLNQREWLRETIENRGHAILYFPEVSL
jgi:hypothetical protein